MPANLLHARELRTLDGLRFDPRRTFPGRAKGERLTKKKGVSIEFSDYRDYAAGDDLRHLDWNVFARLDQPIVKTYQDEEDLAVHLMVDCSPSMEFGQPTKLESCVRFAAGLSYVALCSGDAAFLHSAGSNRQPTGPMRGRSTYGRVCRWFDSVSGNGTTELSKWLVQFAASSARPGIAVLLTDGLDPELPNALRIVCGKGHEVLLLQVLSKAELRPELEGDLRLVDSEGRGVVEITANSPTLKAYQANLTAHNARLAETCAKYGGRYHLVSSDTGLLDVARTVWKREGWLR